MIATTLSCGRLVLRKQGLFSRRALALFSALLAALLATGCGSLVDMGGKERVNPRRIYLNDPAANDSLPGTLRTEGLLLVMQPGSKQYRVVTDSGNPADPLDFYVRNAGGGFTFQEAVAGTTSGDEVTYTLTAPASKTTADYYLVFLRGAGNAQAAKPSRVRFFPVDTALATTVGVRLHMIRELSGLDSDADKALYAAEFHDELQSLFQAHGIAVDTSTAIVEPDSTGLTVVFNGDPITLPGTRLAGAINMYLVNSIEGGDEGSVVVGFAPREAFDLSANEESRIVLNVQGYEETIPPLTIPEKARAMAVTAAHEMGHFLGLRHTSATRIDREYDGDESNRNDGFESTPFCSILEKRSVAGEREISVKGPGGRPYCLRVTGTAVECGTVCEDRTNLMYPYKCPDVVQKTLGGDQQTVMRNNLKLYQ